MSGLEPPSREERQPSPVPDSTLARNFSDQLDGLFNLGGELSGLTQSVEDKRQTIFTQNKELEALEARIKMAETKLQQAGGQGAASGGSQPPKDVRDVFPASASVPSNGTTGAAAPRLGETAATSEYSGAQSMSQGQPRSVNANGAQRQ